MAGEHFETTCGTWRKGRLVAEYGYVRDTFAGIEHRNAIDGGLDYILVKPDPNYADDRGRSWVREREADDPPDAGSDDASRSPSQRCRAAFLGSAGSHGEHSVVHCV